MQFWGRMASGMLFMCEGHIFLQLRSADVEESGVWGIPGGALEGGWYQFQTRPNGIEPPTLTDDDIQDLWDSAVRETEEEVGYFPSNYRILDTVINWVKNTNFPYVTFILDIPVEEKEAIIASVREVEESGQWESEANDWFPGNELPQDVHHGVEYVLDKWKSKQT